MNIEAPDEWFKQRLKEDDGIFDRASFELCIKVLREHKSQFRIALDIGAHVGSWSIGLAQYFQRVHAFEANENNYKFLIKNVYSNKINITMYNHALGVISDTASIENKPEDNSGMGFISAGNSVSVLRLDQVMEDFNEIDFMKIDVEGFELFVLMGATKTIDINRPVICLELNGSGERYGITDDTVRSVLKQMRYELVAQQNKDFIYVPMPDSLGGSS